MSKKKKWLITKTNMKATYKFIPKKKWQNKFTCNGIEPSFKLPIVA